MPCEARTWLPGDSPRRRCRCDSYRQKFAMWVCWLRMTFEERLIQHQRNVAQGRHVNIPSVRANYEFVLEDQLSLLQPRLCLSETSMLKKKQKCSLSGSWLDGYTNGCNGMKVTGTCVVNIECDRTDIYIVTLYISECSTLSNHTIVKKIISKPRSAPVGKTQ